MVCQSMEWLDSGELRGFYNCRLKIEEFGFWGGDGIWSFGWKASGGGIF